MKTTPNTPDLNQIKRLVVMAMFSDDKLMQRFVLKGGNAIDLVYGAGTRGSLDIDLSIEDDFSPEELLALRQTIETNLQKTFRPEGYEVFSVTVEKKPEEVTADLSGFWGGYLAAFKLIQAAKYAELRNDPERLSRSAMQIGAKGRFEIDISRFEYCAAKRRETMEGVTIFVYTPEMLVGEKLRALCQQMPEYGPIVKRNRPGSARARDFFDIHTLVTHCHLHMATPENRELVRHIFEAKRVPWDFLAKISEQREFHRPDFDQVRATVRDGLRPESFDAYFDFVVDLCKTLGHV